MRALVLLALALAGCPKPTPSPVPPPPDASDAAAYDSSGPATCLTACANLRALGCPEAMGAGDGSASCESACQHINDTNLTQHLDVACLTAAPTPSTARACVPTQPQFCGVP